MNEEMKVLAWLIAIIIAVCVGTSVVFAIQERNLSCLLLDFGFMAYIIGKFTVEDVLRNEL